MNWNLVGTDVTNILLCKLVANLSSVPHFPADHSIQILLSQSPVCAATKVYVVSKFVICCWLENIRMMGSCIMMM